MDCKNYQKWLEARDLSDLSESDRAERHSSSCSDCRELAEKDALLDRTIARGLEREPLPAHLEKIVALNLSSGRPTRRFSPWLIKGVSALTGILALVAIYLVIPSDNASREQFSIALARDHSALEQLHPVDPVVNVPDWLASHADFRATLPASFGLFGFELVGARVCVIENCSTLHLVYRDGDRYISLYIADASQVPASMSAGKTYSSSADGLKVKLWREDRQVYGVVS